jgi:Tol biopolymer transport system component
MEVETGGDHRVRPLVQSPFSERNGVVSSDGRWLAYEALESGRAEIYVRPYPDTTTGRWQVSSAGGTRPLWSQDGTELFFVGPTGAIMDLGVEKGASWTTTTPTTLIKEGYVTQPQGNPVATMTSHPTGDDF